MLWACRLFAQEEPAPVGENSVVLPDESEVAEPQVTAEEPVEEEVTSKYWNFYWQNGLYYQWIRTFTIGGTNRWLKKQTEEKVGFSGKLGGMIQTDGAVYWPADSVANFENGAELRRARVYTKGEFYLHFPIHYKFQIGYDNPDWVLYDAFFWVQDIPWIQTFKFGYFKLPMSLSGSGSSRDTLMMERPSVVNAFYAFQRTGVQIGGPSPYKRVTWNLGVFSVGQTLEEGDSSESQLRLATRVTGLPWYVDEEGKTPGLLHVGLSGNYTYAGDGNIQYRARPESHLAPHLIDTGNINARYAVLLGAEVAWVKGPWSVQAEAIRTHVNTVRGDSATFAGLYADGSFFITGESRPYDQDTGLFSRVHPIRALSFGGQGFGALEAVVHASYTDLSDNRFDGGSMSVFGGGLNWHINSAVDRKSVV